MTVDFRRLLYVNAYQVYMGTLHSCSAPITRELAEIIRAPRPGDLVMEISTIYMPERDEFRFGRLLRKVNEPTRTQEEWAEEGGRQDEAVPMQIVWYIELPDAREYRWHNAGFIRVLDEPVFWEETLRRAKAV